MELRLTDYEDPEVYLYVAALLKKLAQYREDRIAKDAEEIKRWREEEDAERAAGTQPAGPPHHLRPAPRGVDQAGEEGPG